MSKHDERTVIVLNLDNYKNNYQEPVPFKAICTEIYDNEVWVVSKNTEKLYEVYPDQILEFCSDEQIKNLLNLENYGS